MKKSNRRSNSKSVSGSSSPIPTHDKPGSVRRIHDLELENEVLKEEIKILRQKLDRVSSTSGCEFLKQNGEFSRRPSAVVKEVPPFSSQRHKMNEAASHFQDDIQKLKAQKVQLQCKMKLESMSFRSSKASLEKEILQLKKAERRNNYAVQLLSALNRRQKLVLERKMEEAFIATKRLKELIEARKTSPQRTTVRKGKSNEVQARNRAEMEQLQGIEGELEIQGRMKKIYTEYENQIKEMVGEIKRLKQESQSLKDEISECLSLHDEAVLKDSELTDLKEEVTRLSCLLSQMNVSKSQLTQEETSQANTQEVDGAPSSISVGSNIHISASVTSGAEHPEVLTATGEKKQGDCCSCSKKSLCKTLKYCGCRAAGRSCGTSCGCAASKCTNRVLASSKLENLLQCDTSEDVAKRSGNIEERAVNDAKIPMAKKHRDKTQEIGLRKKPLRDIGNTLIK